MCVCVCVCVCVCACACVHVHVFVIFVKAKMSLNLEGNNVFGTSLQRLFGLGSSLELVSGYNRLWIRVKQAVVSVVIINYFSAVFLY